MKEANASPKDAALKLALEALESALRYHGIMLMSDPPQDAWKYHRVENKADKAITAIKEASAQPEEQQSCDKQEPVATLDDLEQEIYENTRQFVSRDVMEWMLKRYYTTPPQRTWVGLTDEEVDECFSRDPRVAIRNAEAKLKEKNT